MLIWFILVGAVLYACCAGLRWNANTSSGKKRDHDTEAREAAVRASNATEALGYRGPPVVPPVGEWLAGQLGLARRRLG
jgi:hypothetical protein